MHAPTISDPRTNRIANLKTVKHFSLNLVAIMKPLHSLGKALIWGFSFTFNCV